MNFKKGENHLFRNGNTIWLQNNPVFKDEEFENPEDYLKKISREAYGDENASFAGNGFRIGLPTSINAITVSGSRRIISSISIGFREFLFSRIRLSVII